MCRGGPSKHLWEEDSSKVRTAVKTNQICWMNDDTATIQVITVWAIIAHTNTHSVLPYWKDEYSTDTMLARASAQWGTQSCILGKWTSMNHRGIREQRNNHCVPLLLRAGEELSLLTAAQIWRGQTLWVQTGLLVRPLAGLQIRPRGRHECVCVLSP